jgi:hypothetical protein
VSEDSKYAAEYPENVEVKELPLNVWWEKKPTKC